MPAYVARSAPIIAIIGRDYPLRWEADVDAIIKLFSDSPPTLLTTGDDLVFNPHGAVWFCQPNGEAWITPEEATTLGERLRQWIERAHATGVQYILPYVCSGHIFGDPYKRAGMWMLYDRWEQHAHNLGPKPAVDPVDWVQREPNGARHFNYPYRFIGASADRPWMAYEFAGCVNNPYWSDWLARTVKLAAQAGYDGIFIDNNIHHCYCEHCNAAFREYLTETYTPAQLRQRFGNADVAGLRLSPLGDKVLWATGQPEYMRQIRDGEPDVFRTKFGTDDLDQAVPSEGGNGFHWGRAHDFWVRKLKESHTSEEVEQMLRVGNVTSLGITTPRDLCLWADTQKLWAWSIGKAQARLRAAAETVRPGFLIMPNWGDMAGFRNVDSRRLEAKNVRLWKGGADIIFFEQEYFPCTLAPGYTFDLVIPYKYSAACGIRSTMLPYHGAQHRALTELGFAEATAWSGDGMFMHLRYKFPEIRDRYKAFYELRADWFAGHASYAQVGLLLSFDEVHFENTHHLRETYALAHYLLDHHILFDFLCEGQVTLKELRRFKLVILPHTQYLPRRARATVLRYLNEGGNVLVTGNTGAFDEHARLSRSRDLLANLRSPVWPGHGDARAEYRGRGNVAWINDVFSWLPKRAWQVHDLADFNVGPLYNQGIYDQVVAAAKGESDDLRLATLCDELAGMKLAVLPEATPSTLRAAAWRSIGRKPSIVMHLVNYNVPGDKLSGNCHDPAPEQVEEVPVRDAEVTLLLPEAMSASEVLVADPQDPDPVRIPFRQRGRYVQFVVPSVAIYRAIRIR